MFKKHVVILIIIGVILISFVSIMTIVNTRHVVTTSENSNHDTILPETIEKKYHLDFDLVGGHRINIDQSDLVTNYSYLELYENDTGTYHYSWFEPKEQLSSVFDTLKNKSEKTIVIIPIFTHSAYVDAGFYDYYKKSCDEKCLTVKIERLFPMQYNAAKNTIQILRILNYTFITDIEIDENPQILMNYDKVILLHSEYVTQNEFNALVNHPHVLYLYPNSLYAKINYDQKNDTITLIRGHGYPTIDVDNGFDWKYDNTHPYEFDTSCNDWKFYDVGNGKMLNCFPENIIWKDELLLKAIKDF